MIEKAYKILEAITQTRGNNSLNIISDRVGIPRSTVHRLLKMMQDCEMIDYDPDKGYLLSSKLVRMCLAGVGDRDFLDVAIPVAQELNSKIRETISINVLVGYERTCVYRVEGDLAIIRSMKIGTHNPLFIGSTGKVLAAGLSGRRYDEAKAYSLEKGKINPEELGKLDAVIEKCRRNGYAVSVQERYAGCWSMAVPIINPITKEMLGTLSISSVLERYTRENVEQYLKLLKESARKIQLRLF
ncbi:MAG: IclR family transcriptional regulator [Lachnospiraceae bacterium]|nr:IclR family transcriptional regulator [Lachnospiraceae bacterium]